MDDAMKHLRVRFSGVGQENQDGSETTRMPAKQERFFIREEMNTGEEYDAAYAASVAAVAYAIAAREEKKIASKEAPVTEKSAPHPKKPAANNETSTVPTLKLPPSREETIKRPRTTEGSRFSRRLSSKELAEDDDDDQLGANVSVRRPLKAAEKKPEVGNSGQNAAGKVPDPAPSIRNDKSFARNLPEKKASKKFEQEQATPRMPPDVRPAASFPPEKKESKKFEQEKANQMPPPPAATPTSSFSAEAEAMADAWEKEKMAKIKKQYNATMETIAEWEAEKKAKAKRQMEQKQQGDSERKREKALEEYNDDMARINRVASASRLTAEDKRRSAERKVRDKAYQIRVTGKLPRSCGCF